MVILVDIDVFFYEKIKDNNMQVENVRKYVQELFTGASKIISYCKVHDCSMCTSSTKLYKKVLNFHNTDSVKDTMQEYSNNLQNTKIKKVV